MYQFDSTTLTYPCSPSGRPFPDHPDVTRRMTKCDTLRHKCRAWLCSSNFPRTPLPRSANRTPAARASPCAGRVPGSADAKVWIHTRGAGDLGRSQRWSLFRLFLTNAFRASPSSLPLNSLDTGSIVNLGTGSGESSILIAGKQNGVLGRDGGLVEAGQGAPDSCHEPLSGRVVSEADLNGPSQLR